MQKDSGGFCIVLLLLRDRGKEEWGVAERERERATDRQTETERQTDREIKTNAMLSFQMQYSNNSNSHYNQTFFEYIHKKKWPCTSILTLFLI